MQLKGDETKNNEHSTVTPAVDQSIDLDMTSANPQATDAVASNNAIEPNPVSVTEDASANPSEINMKKSAEDSTSNNNRVSNDSLLFENGNNSHVRNEIFVYCKI